MPIYEYQCQSCGSTSEILIFSSTQEVTCPACGSTNLKKLISATSTLTGTSSDVHRLPGPKDHGCCGYRPGEAPNCQGPGSCCGKAVR